MSEAGPGWGAIFDWDGVITDSGPLHERSWEMLAERRGLSLPLDHFQRSFGQRNEEIIPAILGWTDDPAEIRRLSDEKEEYFRELVRRDGLVPLPGVAGWLERLAAAGIPCAVGSSTPRANIDCALEILGLGGAFRHIVASEDVVRGKPRPDVFLACGRGLGLAPGRAVVFEDAPVGIEAGRAAGYVVIAVRTTHPASVLQGAHRVVERLDALDLDEVAGMLGDGAPVGRASGPVDAPPPRS